MVLITNSQMVRQYFQRVVTAPDITISAADMPPNLPTTYLQETLPQPTFTKGALYASAAGPGTITPPGTTAFVFNKIGDLFLNGPAGPFTGSDTNQFLTVTEGTQSTSPYFSWASFDGSTNLPILYPNGADLQNLAYQMVIQVTPTPGVLPDGYTTSAINIPFSVTGGGAFTKPYTWSATGLPSGLQIVSNPDSTGALTGTPSQTGTFDITVQLTDNVGRPVSWNYAITIH